MTFYGANDAAHRRRRRRRRWICSAPSPSTSLGGPLLRRRPRLCGAGSPQRPPRAAGWAAARRHCAATASRSFFRTRRSSSSRSSRPGSWRRSRSASIRCIARPNSGGCLRTARRARRSATTINGAPLRQRRPGIIGSDLLAWTSGREFQTRNDLAGHAAERDGAGLERSQRVSGRSLEAAAAPCKSPPTTSRFCSIRRERRACRKARC